MNQKLCKRLRRQARALTVGKPARRLLIDRQTYINDPQSTRGVYRRMKREVRAGLRIG